MDVNEIQARAFSLKSSNAIKKFLIRVGYKERKCEICKHTEWLGSPVPLELHHIDGNHTNNELSNLTVICPNCHYLQPHFRGNNKRKNVISDEQLKQTLESYTTISSALYKLGESPNAKTYARARSFIVKYNIKLRPIESKFKISEKELVALLSECMSYRECMRSLSLKESETNSKIVKELLFKYGIKLKTKPKAIKKKKINFVLPFNKTKANYPPNKILAKLVWEKPITKIAKEFGVTDNAVRHYCRHRNIHTPPPGYWRKLEVGKFDECKTIKQTKCPRSDSD